jgi:hypothetical protein
LAQETLVGGEGRFVCVEVGAGTGGLTGTGDDGFADGGVIGAVVGAGDKGFADGDVIGRLVENGVFGTSAGGGAKGVGIEGDDDELGGSGGGRGISKISTASEIRLTLLPPPKNILFVDDVDARA